MNRQIANQTQQKSHTAAPVSCGILQRTGINTSPLYYVPQREQPLLRSPDPSLGEPADAFAESRFGHDFSRVRTYTDQSETVAAFQPQSFPQYGSSGQPLSGAIRSLLERQFQAPLDQVRVHDDSSAAQAARKHGAQAMTLGEHIYFGRGRYQPDHPEGRQLLAHEITHVLQQQMPGPSSPVAALESEAQDMARQSPSATTLPSGSCQDSCRLS